VRAIEDVVDNVNGNGIVDCRLLARGFPRSKLTSSYKALFVGRDEWYRQVTL